MIEKLNELEKKYEELNGILADPAVIADQAAYQKHAKAHRDLHEIVEKFAKYKEILNEIEETKALTQTETDPEMKKLADDELAALVRQLETSYDDSLLEDDGDNGQEN